MSIPSYNFTVHQGNSGTVSNPLGVVVRLKDDNGVDEDLTGSTFVFIASLNGDTLRKENASVNGAEVTAPISVEESRFFAAGSYVPYELEQRYPDGAQRTRLKGYLIIDASINDDV